MEKYIPIRASFHISNPNYVTPIVLSNLIVQHELLTTVINNSSNKVETTAWGLSSSSFVYAEDEKTTSVRQQAVNEVKGDNADFEKESKVKVEFETVPVVDLGLYSNTQDNNNFNLVNEKQIVQPNTIGYFQFRFLISKEVLKNFTTMLPSEEKFYEGYGNDVSNSLNLNLRVTDGYNIDDIKELKLKLSLSLSATSPNTEFIFTKYYNYQ
ncbi:MULTISPECIES: hypothetical protein [Flavobacteriaceae]|uniref:hypothetical protein n=1 Tax=Flavobacteriaceae TaxID=49546 RepID=UPI001490989C|nr:MULTISPECIES: hypothetical protein [Allomuricauda]MDC6364702.1 hypothetical protein [Muricauda sp. AC10]